MSSSVIAARHDFPVLELAPLEVSSGQTVEDMVAGLPHNHPDLTSEHFSACRSTGAGGTLFLAKPLADRQHRPVDDLLRLLDAAQFAPVGLPELAALKQHADELWAAGVYNAIALARECLWEQPDGRYAPYLVLNPEDRGFHLQWLGPDSEGGTKAVPEEVRAELNGQMWFLVRRK
jgi:hypothetical protein